MKTHVLEEYIQQADQLAQEVVHAWVVNVNAGNSSYLTPEFKSVFDKAFEHRQSKKIADNHREFNILAEEDSTAERSSREIFAAAYKRWMESQISALIESL
jgi:hypothetical protein